MPSIVSVQRDAAYSMFRERSKRPNTLALPLGPFVRCLSVNNHDREMGTYSQARQVTTEVVAWQALLGVASEESVRVLWTCARDLQGNSLASFA
jgi:hypothetical protein